MSKLADLGELRIVEPLHVRLRRIREQNGLTRSELAERTGLSRPTIWAWEMGRTQPRRNNLLILAGALGISASELIGTGSRVISANMKAEMMPSRQRDFVPSDGNGQRLRIMIYAAKLGIAALAGVKARNVKISIEL